MIEKMTRDLFLERVFDYQNEQVWHYRDESPCVIDFHDDSCPPCRVTHGILQKLACEFTPRVRFYQVDTKAETTLARDLGIQNLPTIVLCPVGEKPIVFEGAAQREQLHRTIERELLNDRNVDQPPSLQDPTHE